MNPKSKEDSNVEFVAPIESFKGLKLPSNSDVLGRLRFIMNNQHAKIKPAAKIVVTELQIFWDKYRIPVIQHYNAVVKLIKLFKKMRAIKKKSSHASDKQKKQESIFMNDLDGLFDIARRNALDSMKSEKDKKFLTLQREAGRPGSAFARVKKGNIDEEPIPEPEPSLESHSATSIFTIDGGDLKPCTRRTISEPSKKKIMTPLLAATLDRIGLTDRNAMYVISAVLTSAGLNLENFTVSRQTISRARAEYREAIAQSIQSNLDLDGPLVVHWDEKLLPDLTGTEKVERLPVLVSSGKDVQLLGVPKLSSGTGAKQAHEVCSLMETWELSDRICAMGFDTTAANTGVKKGACTLIEKQIGRDLLWLACRHHIAEVLMTAAWEKLFPSKGPSSSIFVRFKSAWPTMDQTFDENMVDQNIVEILGDEVHNLIQFLTEQLNRNHERQDYKELLDLALTFIGAKRIKISPPGAHSNARWMAKAIYCLKIWLFRDQFDMTDDERQNIPVMCVFILRVYIWSWFNAPLPSSAARNDLKLAKKLIDLRDTFPDQSRNVYKAAASRFANHLWYLSEELVALAFFDSEISIDEKKEMAHNLKFCRADETRKIKLKVSSIDKLTSCKLSDFVSQNTMNFFEISGISPNFLKEDPSKWPELEEFVEARNKINLFLVVNDCAERGVKLVQEFCGKMTKNEEQLQYLLKVVQQHRQSFPCCTRSVIMEGLGIEENK